VIIPREAEPRRRRKTARRDPVPAEAGPTRVIEPKQARAHETRARLLDALSGLLQERPSGDISVADIAAAAGLTTGAVYARFGDKHGVAVALSERFLADSAELLDAWGAQHRWLDATPGEIIESWTRGAVNFHREYRPILALMLSDPTLRSQHTALIDHSSRILANLLRDAMKGRIDEHFGGDVNFAVRAILERLELQDDDESYERISRLIGRITGVGE
jgi:AcrR family transcriptional regulator